jgi:hypothetical protein
MRVVPNKLQFTREKHFKTTYLRWEGLENVERRKMKKNSKNSLSLYIIKKAEKVKPTRVKTGELLESGKIGM